MASRGTQTPPAPERQGDNLTRISGVGPVVAGRLGEAGIRTYRSIADATPEDLAAALVGLPGCSAHRIRTADWVGQAARLDGARRPARGPGARDDAPRLRVVRLGRAQIRPLHDASRSDRPTTVGIELGPVPAAAAAEDLRYTAAIVARRLDAEGETPIVQVGGVVREDQGISHSAAGPPLEAGLYRLVADIQLHLTGQQPGEPPISRQAASGDLIQVVAPAGATRHRNGGAKPHPAGKQLLEEGVISEAEYADLQVPVGS